MAANLSDGQAWRKGQEILGARPAGCSGRRSWDRWRRARRRPPHRCAVSRASEPFQRV